MKTNYKQSESTVKPLEIDITSSPDGVYIRRDIKEVEKETDNGSATYYDYAEAFVSQSEYEKIKNDLLVEQINGEDNTAEYDEYKEKLDTGVKYKNGKYYKPKWIDVYSPILKDFKETIELYERVGGDASSILDMTFNVYDVTGTTENAEEMTVKEIIELWLFLYKYKEIFYNEYKASLE